MIPNLDELFEKWWNSKYRDKYEEGAKFLAKEAFEEGFWKAKQLSILR